MEWCKWCLAAGVLVLLQGYYGECKQYCKVDGDCSDLGDSVICVKTHCEWGICGCRRNEQMRYIGYPPHRYKCVPNMKVGEECSMKGDGGVCAAPNSFCYDGTCRCMAYYNTTQGGKMCTKHRLIGETCQLYTANDFNSDCESGSVCRSQGYPLNSAMHTVVWNGPATCACGNSQTLDFVLPYGPNSDWTKPICRPKRIGDICLRHEDCPNAGLGPGKCSNNKCACETNKVPDYTMQQSCKDGLNFGDVCNPIQTAPFNAHCDGSKGLMCGDTCDVQAFLEPATTLAPKKCACGPTHSKSGSTCVKRGVGSSCHGDDNCKGIGSLARCHKGECKAGGVKAMAGLLLILSLSLVAWMAP